MSEVVTYRFVVESVNIFCQDFVDRVGFFECNETETSGKKKKKKNTISGSTSVGTYLERFVIASFMIIHSNTSPY